MFNAVPYETLTLAENPKALLFIPIYILINGSQLLSMHSVIICKEVGGKEIALIFFLFFL